MGWTMDGEKKPKAKPKKGLTYAQYAAKYGKPHTKRDWYPEA